MSDRLSRNTTHRSISASDVNHGNQTGSKFTRFCQSLINSWKNWTGDRELDIAIRRHLSDQGYQGVKAELKQVKLIAVKRPGWVQIYRFEAVAHRQIIATLEDGEPLEPNTLISAPAPSNSQLLYGLARDDGRFGCEVQTFIHPARRIELFKQWSEGLIILRGAFNTQA